MTQQYLAKIMLSCSVLALLCFAFPLGGQTQSQDKPSGAAEPSITITVVPPAGGGPGRMEPIAGRVEGKEVTHYRVVLFSRTDRWYVQPYVSAPLTDIKPDGSWTTSIHLGSEYAALLVEPSYKPPTTTAALPQRGDGVIDLIRVPAK